MLSPDYAESTEGIEKAFHTLYYDDFEGTWETTTWMGTKVLKNPMDLWTYQEIIWEIKPELIIETGTAHGGSAMYFAGLLDITSLRSGAGGGVVTIDIHGREQFPKRPTHPRITYLKGSSVSLDILVRVEAMRNAASGPVMVVLDSDHREDHVYAELEAYHRFVTPGSYLVVEDTNVNSRPVCPEHGPGPGEALDRWLPQHPEFSHDPHKQRLHLSFNPGGWLRRA